MKTNVTNALNAGSATGQMAAELVGAVATGLCAEPGEGFGSLPTDFAKLSPAEATTKLNALLAQFPAPPARATSARISGGRKSTGGGQGRKGASSGAGRGGRRSTIGRSGSGAVRPAAQRLASFLSSVPKVGLRQALRDAGIPNADSLLPSQLALAIADVLSTDASQIIQAELRAALVTVLETICSEPDSIDTAEALLTDAAYDMADVVQMLFESYIMERFKTFFCEHEAAKHGFEAADNILKEARQFVSVEMQLVKADRHDLTAVDWAGPEGAKIVDAVLERTIAIYSDT
ncbi:MAG: hypothetical protein JXR37_08710 [Kiritimatiellae bacterium]|nr:hypothetical protein [Kiritimatiellia bacterium]